MGEQNIRINKCPFCAQALDDSGESMNSCSMCGMKISGRIPHIMLVAEEGFHHYCSIRCMDLHEEYLENEDGGELE
jgi:hypothetical protein